MQETELKGVQKSEAAPCQRHAFIFEWKIIVCFSEAVSGSTQRWLHPEFQSTLDTWISGLMVIVWTELFPIPLVTCVHICDSLRMKSMFPTAALLRCAVDSQVTPEEGSLTCLSLQTVTNSNKGHQRDQRKLLPSFFPPLIQHWL